MKHIILLITICLGVQTSLFAQPEIDWLKTYGGRNGDLYAASAMTEDGGFILVGKTHSFDVAESALYAVRTDDSGDTLWTSVIGGEEPVLCAGMLIHGENYVLYGSIKDNDDDDWDYYFVIINGNGEVMSSGRWGEDFDDRLLQAISTDDGGFILAGEQDLSDDREEDLWIMKVDSALEQSWSWKGGGLYHDYLVHVLSNDTGGCVFGGYIKDLSDDRHDLIIGSLSGEGEEEWFQFYDAEGREELIKMIRNQNGDYTALGVSRVTIHDPDIMIISNPCVYRVNPEGELMWEYKFESPLGVVCFDMIESSDGNIALTGYQSEFEVTEIFFLLLDENGDEVINNTYFSNGPNEQGLRLLQTREGGYLLAGSATRFVEPHYYEADIIAIHVNQEGEAVWTLRHRTENYSESIKNIFMLDDGSYVFAGSGMGIFIGSRARLLLARTDVDPVSVRTQEHTIPVEFSINSIYPNPFNSSTTITYTLPVSSDISVSVFDLSGRQVAELVSGKVDAGRHSVVWNAQGVVTGVYVIRLSNAEGKTAQIQKCILVK